MQHVGVVLIFSSSCLKYFTSTPFHRFYVHRLQYGNVGAMAITLCQSLGQNIGMRWNNARNSAGKRIQESLITQEGRWDLQTRGWTE